MRACECAAMHSRCRAGGERTVSNSQRFLSSFHPTCHLVCDPPLLRSTVVLMCSVLLMLTLSSPAPFSLPLPHCLQLHLFPSMWRMIAGLLFFFLFLMLHFSLLVLAPSLSLCPSSPSQPPTTPFSFSPPAHCHLLVPAQAPSRGLREAGGGGG